MSSTWGMGAAALAGLLALAACSMQTYNGGPPPPYHPASAVVVASPASIVAGEPVRLELSLVDAASGAPYAVEWSFDRLVQPASGSFTGAPDLYGGSRTLAPGSFPGRLAPAALAAPQTAALHVSVTDRKGRTVSTTASVALLPAPLPATAVDLTFTRRGLDAPELVWRNVRTARGLVLTLALPGTAETQEFVLDRTDGQAVLRLPREQVVMYSGPLAGTVRYADEPASAAQPFALDLPPFPADALLANGLYALPLQSRAAVGAPVTVALLTGAPTGGTLDNFVARVDCGAPVECVSGSLAFPQGDRGAWRAAAAIPEYDLGLYPVAEDPGIVQVNCIRMLGSADTQAGPGILATFEVRYAQPGQYTVKVQAGQGNSYGTGSVGQQHWAAYNHVALNVPSLVRVE